MEIFWEIFRKVFGNILKILKKVRKIFDVYAQGLNNSKIIAVPLLTANKMIFIAIIVIVIVVILVVIILI